MNALPRLLWAWMLTLLLACHAHAQQFKPVPALRARVTDEIGMLTPEQRQKLEGVLADYEAKTGSQIGVLLVASTEPEAIEQYSIRVADAWKLGRKGVDDGVLLVDGRDPAAFATALGRAIADGGLRLGLIEAGHRNVRRFDWATTADRLVGVYRELIAESAPAAA